MFRHKDYSRRKMIQIYNGETAIGIVIHDICVFSCKHLTCYAMSWILTFQEKWSETKMLID